MNEKTIQVGINVLYDFSISSCIAKKRFKEIILNKIKQKWYCILQYIYLSLILRIIN